MSGFYSKKILTSSNKDHISKPKVKLLLKDSYLKMIENSVGTNCFRHLFAKVDGQKEDVLKDGELSCAYFVSCILSIFGLIDRPHATVKSTVKAMEKFGWQKISRPKKGAVLIWQEQKFNSGNVHGHIGFYLGPNQAISNSYSKRQPISHHPTYNNQRKIIAIFWHRKLD